MAKHIELDSIWRDFVEYPNPAKFNIGGENINCWYPSDRTLTKGGNIKLENCMSTVNLVKLTLPYTDEVAAFPRLYVNLTSTDTKDKNLVFSMADIHKDVKFVCYPCHIQKDGNDVPIWIHYDSRIEQTMRLSFDNDIKFEITTRSGNELVLVDDTDAPNPMKQVMATFTITPYLRDADYDNHFIGVV